MTVSTAGLNLIKGAESFRSKAYKDGGGVWTIGYGTTQIPGRAVQPGDTCTEAEALVWFNNDIRKFTDAVNRGVKVTLRQCQFDALVSLAYNVGVGAFQESTLLKLVNSNPNDLEIAREFCKWRKDNGQDVRGLLLRRLREASFYFTW